MAQEQTKSVDPEQLETLWQEGEQAYQQQDWGKAEALLSKVADLNPRYKQVQWQLKQTRKQQALMVEYRRLCAFDDSQWKEVKTGFELIRRQNPNFPDTQHLLDWIEEQEWFQKRFEDAQYYAEIDDTASAIKVLAEIIDIYPEYQQAVDMLEVVTVVDRIRRHDQRRLQRIEAVKQTRSRVKALRAQREREEAVRQEVIRLVTITAIVVILIVMFISYFG